MTVILSPDYFNDGQILSVVCNRCKKEVVDPMDRAEVLHFRFNTGHPSQWGDENRVELDLCDACGFELFSEYATVSPLVDSLAGTFVGGLNAFHRCHDWMIDGLTAPPGMYEPLPPPQDEFERSMYWGRYALSWALIPLILLARPLVKAVKRAGSSFAEEADRLRFIYGIDRPSDSEPAE